ncbi:hypothetical protein [Mesorhizobium sp. 2RAF21]|uniref:hypothetical protein n=1 Tax=Mesorhizobium sp. 2RAF21 TaxID=3232995 RepID=UPI003F967BEC
MSSASWRRSRQTASPIISTARSAALRASRHFLEVDYPYLIPGVSRHATNHIVDADGDGVAVRYHNLLVRYAPVDAAPGLGTGKVLDSEDDLPAIWIYSPMLDRLRRVDGAWKIFERHVGGSMTNRRLEPLDRDPHALAAFMPKPVSSPGEQA